jgi:hypothetical protein
LGAVVAYSAGSASCSCRVGLGELVDCTNRPLLEAELAILVEVQLGEGLAARLDQLARLIRPSSFLSARAKRLLLLALGIGLGSVGYRRKRRRRTAASAAALAEWRLFGAAWQRENRARYQKQYATMPAIQRVMALLT